MGIIWYNKILKFDDDDRRKVIKFAHYPSSFDKKNLYERYIGDFVSFHRIIYSWFHVHVQNDEIVPIKWWTNLDIFLLLFINMFELIFLDKKNSYIKITTFKN